MNSQRKSVASAASMRRPSQKPSSTHQSTSRSASSYSSRTDFSEEANIKVKPKKKWKLFKILGNPFKKKKKLSKFDISLSDSNESRSYSDGPTEHEATTSNQNASNAVRKTPASPKTAQKVALQNIKQTIVSNLTASQPSSVPTPTPKPRSTASKFTPLRMFGSPPFSMPKKASPSSPDRYKAHYLVVEIVYSGRSLEPNEKALVQSKVAEIVDAMLKPSSLTRGAPAKATVNSALATPTSTRSTKAASGEDRLPSPIFARDHSIKYQSTPFPPDKKNIKLTPQVRPHGPQRPSPRQPAFDSLELLTMEAEQKAINLRDRIHDYSNKMAYENANVTFNVRHNKSHAQLAKQVTPKRPKNPSPSKRRPSSTAVRSIEQKKQQLQHQRDENDSLMQLMDFMNNPNRSTSATSSPRRYQRVTSPSASPVQPQLQQYSPDLAAMSPMTVSSPDVMDVDKMGATFVRATDSSDIRARSSNDVSHASGMHPSLPEQSTPLRTSFRGARWHTPTDHRAWWMPREWARERHIGAYDKDWRFSNEEEQIRKRELEVAKNPNVEKIRTCNFVRI